MQNEKNNNSNLVTIQKWILGDGQIFYWIGDINGLAIDGFRKKYQAIDAIERWNLKRVSKLVKTIQ